jgi:hypothetical protein
MKPFTPAQSKRKLQPIMDRLLGMRWEIPVDVTGGDQRIASLESPDDREQHVPFNPFYYTVSKAKLGSDGITRKPDEVQAAVAANVARIEEEGRLVAMKRGLGRKGSKDQLKMFRLPSYFEIVHRPMSLQKIQRKLNTDKGGVSYDHYDIFLNDVKLISDNARAYYGDENHAIHVAAVEMLRECKRLMSLSSEGKLKLKALKKQKVSLKKTNKRKKMKQEKREKDKRATTGRVRAKVQRLIPGTKK